MLEKAFQATTMSRESRYFETLTFAVPQTLMPQLVSRIQRFVREWDTFVEASADRDTVYQIGIQLFPLTKPEPKPTT